jgi:hypothetical protein
VSAAIAIRPVIRQIDARTLYPEIIKNPKRGSPKLDQ